MRRIFVSVEPSLDGQLDVEIYVIDPDGLDPATPLYEGFTWFPYDLLGQEKPWRMLLREIAGSIPS